MTGSQYGIIASVNIIKDLIRKLFLLITLNITLSPGLKVKKNPGVFKSDKMLVKNTNIKSQLAVFAILTEIYLDFYTISSLQ